MLPPLSISKTSTVVSSVVLLAIVAFLASIWGFGEALVELIRRWSHAEEYSHGFLIPIVSGWLLWARRDALFVSVGQPSFLGPCFVVLAIAMHIIGELSAIWILSQLGFVVALFGIVLAIGGYSLFRITLIPLAYLFFAIPLPYFIDATLTLKLQLISSELGVWFISLFQIPVYLDGNIIDLGTYKLQVVEACSGLRYLYPLLSLSFLAAYLFQGRLWQRVAVFLSAIPIAIAMNGVRIGLVGVLVDRWGTPMAEGALHFFEGWVIFVACSALLVGEMYVLARVSGRQLFDVFHLPKVEAILSDAAVVKYRSQIPIVASLSLLCFGALAVFAVSGRSELIPDRTRFVAFPMRLADWQGRVFSLDLPTEQFLKVDDYLLANYSRANGKPVNLYVAYYASQRKNESPHSPIVCLPGGGWLIVNLERRELDSAGADYPYNRVVIQNGEQRQLVYYWFDERGRPVADEYRAKLYLFADAVLKNRTDGALIRLSTRISADESEDDADRRLQAFTQLALPQLSKFLPSSAGTPLNSAVVPSSDQS